MTCSIARAVDVIGEPWTPMILRDVFFGVTRFEAIQRNLGISRKVLSERLASLVENGVLTRVAYQDTPPRFDYVLTEKGEDLALVLVAMKAWADRWEPFAEGTPMRLLHRECGGDVVGVAVCSKCGDAVSYRDATLEPGPGFKSGPGTSEIAVALERAAEAAAG
jgi:DNA-binding HxlR family transcriptional regulator